jgi:hypothetical protein
MARKSQLTKIISLILVLVALFGGIWYYWDNFLQKNINVAQASFDSRGLSEPQNSSQAAASVSQPEPITEEFLSDQESVSSDSTQTTGGIDSIEGNQLGEIKGASGTESQNQALSGESKKQTPNISKNASESGTASGNTKTEVSLTVSVPQQP